MPSLHGGRARQQPHVHHQPPGSPRATLSALLPPPKHGPGDAHPSTAIPPEWAQGSPQAPHARGGAQQIFPPNRAQQLCCKVTKSPGMCPMPAFCLGNQFPTGFQWKATPGCQQAAVMVPDPENPRLLPSTLPTAEATSRHPEPPSPFPPRQRLDPPPGRALRGVFEAAPAISAVSALSEAAAPAMSKAWAGGARCITQAGSGPARGGREGFFLEKG